jgi:hypothetical protein
MDVHALDIDNMAWSRIDRIKGPAPKPRCDHTVVVADNLLILSGGRGASTDKPKFSGYFDDVHILDLADQAHAPPAPCARAPHHAPACAARDVREHAPHMPHGAHRTRLRVHVSSY